MSALELENFESQLETLSYSERLSLIEYLAKSMRRTQDAEFVPQKNDWLSDTFALMDSSPVYSNGRKWSREELYER